MTSGTLGSVPDAHWVVLVGALDRYRFTRITNFLDFWELVQDSNRGRNGVEEVCSRCGVKECRKATAEANESNKQASPRSIATRLLGSRSGFEPEREMEQNAMTNMGWCARGNTEKKCVRGTRKLNEGTKERN
jgi:hypothetical protein